MADNAKIKTSPQTTKKNTTGQYSLWKKNRIPKLKHSISLKLEFDWPLPEFTSTVTQKNTS